ncbi:MAG: hypothetical protein A2896_00085 [Candidatus Nealsonbacteria bacterium RIFCSPLOWO2_01_FULL_43_32]|uniref:TGS domain-containing protein n=1 Tax=Candidatus Nealsonbacteria bacterium RIFCSPLOWO2_01_FULL_43_32 TaxID=1801672 RepID=A0A1G2EEL0_9BACT|nr:MAG: hypothetical protein A2896_00085 [Candidatus Nealsonbacteria bacterium RIFCSPLOWO2_01_FULL_43_32]
MRKLLQEIIKQSSDPKLIEKAFKFAEGAHQGQKRFSGEGYILHPLSVAQILSAMRLDQKTVAAGLLHDVPDDTKKTLQDIEKEFGKEVAFLVGGVSKLGKLRYPKTGLDVKEPRARIKKPVDLDLRAENLRKMFFAMSEDLRVILIKLADRLDNMKTLGALPPEKRQRIALETLEVFAPLANRLGMGEMKGKLEDLAFPYLYPKEYEWLKNNIKERYEVRQKELTKIKPLLVAILAQAGIKPIDIHSRPKHYWSLYQKLLRNDMNFESIYDLIAIRVIVQDIKTCYEALGAIHEFWRPLPGRIKDYIASPKPNGYQALHTTVFCSEGKIIEVQVKTREMHEEAERGIAAHWAMKERVNLKTQAKRFAWVQQLKDWQSKILESKEFLEGLKVDFLKNRIFVFTPKGDVIDLPENATPVDFAYAVHSDIGHRCTGAKVNGKMMQLARPLKNGDVVEIITDKNKKPSRDWLKFVKTNLARSRIKGFLKQDSPVQELKTFLKGMIIRLPRLRRPKRIKAPEIEMKVSLAGQTGLQISLAKCCSPKAGDKLKAFITRGRGAIVHQLSCKNIKEAEKKWPQRVIEATWVQRQKT